MATFVFSAALSLRPVHQIWIGEPTVPVIKQNYMETVKRMAELHGATYKLWKNENLTRETFPRLWEPISYCIKNKRPWAMIKDLMEWEILDKEGGIYFDTNVEILNPLGFSGMLVSNATFLSYENIGELSNGVIASSSHSGLTKCALRILVDSTKKFRFGFLFRKHKTMLDKPPNVVTGPRLVKKCSSERDIKLPFILLYPYTPWTGRGGPDACLQRQPGKDFVKIGTRYCLPTRLCALKYPRSWAVDHFDNDGASWV